MVHPIIQATFECYRTKFDDLGNGNFGLRDGFLDPNLEILASNAVSGDLMYNSPRFAQLFNCASAAFLLAEDLKNSGFQVKRKFATSAEGYTQNYMEVLDPETKAWIQLDATPWYQKIGTTHKETGELSDIGEISASSSFTRHNVGQFLATKKLEDGSFVDAYLAGGYFGLAQMCESMEKIIAAKKAGKFSGVPENPHYRFALWVRQNHPPDSKTISRANIFFDVLESSGLARNGTVQKALSRPKEYLEDLVALGICSMRVEGYSDHLINSARGMLGMDPEMGEDNLNYLEQLRTKGRTSPDVVEWLSRHLPVLANVVAHIGHTLKTKGGEIIKMDKHGARPDSLGISGGMDTLVVPNLFADLSKIHLKLVRDPLSEYIIPYHR